MTLSPSVRLEDSPTAAAPTLYGSLASLTQQFGEAELLMDIEKTCIYGLLYLFLALWMASIIGDIYKSNLRHQEQIDANTKNYKESLEHASTSRAEAQG